MARAQSDAAVASALHRERTARSEAEAERANKAKDEFLAMLGHELRNPIGVIAAALTVMERGNATEAHSSRARAAIRRQTEHLARLLDDCWMYRELNAAGSNCGTISSICAAWSNSAWRTSVMVRRRNGRA
jgi:signal transduction histidine kinase